MTDQNNTKESKLEKVFLNERFMAAVCIVMAAAGVASLVLCFREQDAFDIFALLVKLVTAVTMFLAFRSFKWDAAKGLMGGVLFCLMYQDAHLALAMLWSEQNFDAYLASGVQGSLFLAGAGMNLLMTVIITANHFFINYSTHGNPKNVILNRIALVFKLAVCILLIVTNSMLGFSSALRPTGLPVAAARSIGLSVAAIASPFRGDREIFTESLFFPNQIPTNFHYSGIIQHISRCVKPEKHREMY